VAFRCAIYPGTSLSERGPGKDGAPAGRSAARTASARGTGIATDFIRFLPDPPGLGAIDGEGSDWPGFRGPDRNGIAPGAPPLSDLSAGRASLLWEKDLGEGHAGPAAWEGRVYVLDHLEDQRADALRCFALADGRELWRRSYPSPIKRNHGFSRTVPAISGGMVLSLGPLGQAMCVDAKSGDLLWIRDLPAEYGSQVPLWYSGQCPLADSGEAVIAVGGKSLLIGIDLKSGKTEWESGNPGGWKMSHSSIVRARVNGSDVYLYAALGGLAGVMAEGEDRGTIAFLNDEWIVQVMAPSPIMPTEDSIFLTAGYGAGSALFTVKNGKPALLEARSPEAGLASEQQTPIAYRGYLYGVMPKDSGELNGQFICQSAQGSLVWSSGKDARFGLGPYFMADGKFFILGDDGTLYAVKASARGYEALGKAAIMGGQGTDAWAPMALYGSRLLLRDSFHLYCVDLGSGS
jgi:outer membrane protein assembly factor BamB